jgi:hypothetical protein
MGNGSKVFRKTMGMEFVKRANWTSSGLQRMMDRTLCRGRPPPKTKNKLQAERKPVRQKHRPPIIREKRKEKQNNTEEIDRSLSG